MVLLLYSSDLACAKLARAQRWSPSDWLQGRACRQRHAGRLGMCRVEAHKLQPVSLKMSG